MLKKNLDLIIKCPHCDQQILIEELNCKIFRHGILKKTNIQINPHASKLECDNYTSNDLIYGCGKPFKIIEINNLYITEKCDYI